MKIRNGFPLPCNQGWKQAFWQTDSTTTGFRGNIFHFTSLSARVPSSAPPSVLRSVVAGGNPVQQTHNEGRKKGERECNRLGFRARSALHLSQLIASLLSFGIPVFTLHFHTMSLHSSQVAQTPCYLLRTFEILEQSQLCLKIALQVAKKGKEKLPPTPLPFSFIYWLVQQCFSLIKVH